ncbi:MAG: sigma 54-interacting transcriptional regulator [Bacteroidia bacterium]|nr:sigma 54-interacting transcriptional regulator [Bacteroidia bacterium]
MVPVEDAHPVIPGYSVLARVGTGGNGTVYRVARTQDGVEFALKILNTVNAEQLTHLQSEFRILSTLDHPSLVRVHEFGYFDDGRAWFIMDWVEGATLAPAHVRGADGGFDAVLFAELTADLSAALAYIHSQHIFHGDLKPENITVTEERGRRVVRLMDFGLSGVRNGSGISGTLEYMAPEIIRGEAPNAGTDLYALGCLLFTVATGRVPYEADAPATLLRKHLYEAIPALPDDIPAALAAWIRTLMDKEARLRYRSAFQLHKAVSEFLGRAPGIAASGDLRRIRLPEIEREQEHARLTELRNEALLRPVVLCVVGPEGAGTSRMLRSLAADLQLDGVRVHRASGGLDMGVFSPILRIIAALAPGADEGDRRFATLAATFPGALPGVRPAELPALSGDGEQLRVFHAAAEILTPGEESCALIFDNADKADTFTRDFLAFFASYLEASGTSAFLLALGSTDTDLAALADVSASPLWQLMVLEALPRSTTAHALRELLGEVSPSFIDVMHRQSGGVPGKLEELLNFCEGEGILVATEHGWLVHERDNLGAVFPATLVQRYERILKRLSDEERGILSAVVAAALPLSPDALQYATELPAETIRKGLAVLVQEHLLDAADNGFYPAHAAVREAMDTPATSIHRALYSFFLSHPPLFDREAVLAHHALAADLRDEARPLLLSAARERELRFDYAGAAALLRNALTLAQHDAALRFDILDRLTRLSNILGKREDEQEFIEEMLLLAAQSQSPDKLASVYRNQTEYYLATGEYDRARRSAEKALGYCTEADDILGQAFCHQKLGVIEYRTQPGETVLRRYERARDLYATAGAAVDEGNILVDIGLVYSSMLEDAERAFEHFRLAEAIFEACANPRGLTRVFGNMGTQFYALGNYEEALRCHSRANELAKQSGDRRLIAISCGSMGQCEIALCRYSPALLHLQEELRIAGELDDSYLKGKCLENLGNVYMTLGAYDRAVASLQEALSLAEASGDVVSAASCHIDIAGCLIERRDFDGAQKLLAKAEALLSNVEYFNVTAMLHYRYGILHIARSADGDMEKALEAFNHLADIADRQGFDSYSILSRSYAGLVNLRLGRASVALDLSGDAMQMLDERGPLYGGAHDILFNHALILRANRAQSESMELIERAYTELMRSADSISDPQMYRSFLDDVRTNAAIIREQALRHRSDSPGSLTAVREQNLRTLYEVAKKINSVLDLDTLLDSIMDSALEAMNGERGMIFLIEDEQLTLKASRNVEKETIRDATEISLSILRDVLHGGKPIIVSNTSLDESFSRRDSVVNFNIHSLICVPMRSKDTITGTVYVDSRSDAVSAMSFSEIDAEFLEAFANLATIAIENARLHRSLQQENLYLRREVQQRFGFESIIGSSGPMQKLFSETQVAINSEGSVLIYGESGTGKELIAKAIHYNGPRKEKHFVAVDCGALPDTLLESELFGYKRGAFTGAVADKAGLFEEAHNGTLFLDEISNTSLAFQAKLLRVLQEGEFRRVGDPNTRMVNVRVICATNTNLQDAIANNAFRQDLFYRLNVIPITVPPLRERLADIPELVQHFIVKYNALHPSAVTGASAELIAQLQQQQWKGNVRELENLINRMIAQASEALLTTKMMPQEYGTMSRGPDSDTKSELSVSLRAPKRLTTLVDVEKEHITFVLKHCDGNKTEAAKILGLKRTTLVEKMKKLGMM